MKTVHWDIVINKVALGKFIHEICTQFVDLDKNLRQKWKADWRGSFCMFDDSLALKNTEVDC